MNIDFEGQVAIVTGAGRGLGRDYALALAARGAKVIVNDLGGDPAGHGTAAVAQLVVDEIRAAGGTAIASADSVSNADSAKRIVESAISTFGRLDILINNAGFLRDRSFGKMSLEDFESIIQVHLMAPFYMTHAAWPHMATAQYGRIVLATSASGLYGNFGQANYDAAKLGVVGFMQALKSEGLRRGILVNTIAPLAATRLGVGIFSDPIMKKMDPSFVTALVLYLCSTACQTSGDVIESGAGRYAKAVVGRTTGIQLEQNDLTPETIAARYAQITDMREFKTFDSSNQAVREFLGGI